MIYIVAFVTTSLLVRLSQNIKKKNTNLMCLFLSLLVVILLAGLRSFSVGTDTYGYLQNMYLCSLNASSYKEYLSQRWWSVYKYNYVTDYEYGFTFVVYLSSRIFNSPFGPLFFIHLLIFLPLIYILNEERFDLSPSIFVWCYLFFFYNTSLNLLRQFVATSVMMLAVYLFTKKKIFWSIFWALFATLFHKSSILAFALIILIYRFIYFKRFFSGYSKTTNSAKRTSLIIIVLLVFFLASNLIIKFLNNIGFHYLGYIEGGYVISYRMIILKLPILIYILVFKADCKSDVFDFRFYLVMLLLDFLFNQFSGTNQYAGRIAFYFSVFYCFMFSSTTKNLSKASFLKKAINIGFVIAYCFAYFAYYILICNSNETLPYFFMPH